MKRHNRSTNVSNESISRRNFVGKTAAAVTLFNIVPRHILGAPFVPPSEKVNIAGIGIGGQGHGDVAKFKDQNIVALCDVDQRYAARTFKEYSKAKRYRDFRVMLEKQKDIDAVVVATPDHLHAVISMTAIKMKKHVYCEKPLTHTVYEARKLAEAAREHGVATQMGNQGQASEQTRRVSELIWDGAIGNVKEVHVWTDRHLKGIHGVYWPQGVDRPRETPPVPGTLEWDLWLGPAPERPYHPAYLPFKWRGWWDFGTGALGDIGCHAMDPIFRALKLEHPTSVDAASSEINLETYPAASTVHYRFPARGAMSPVDLTWYDGGLRPARPAELEDGKAMGTNGTLFIGDKGKMLNGVIIPESDRKAYTQPPKTIPRSVGHHQEWVNACKGGEPAGSNFDFAGRLTEVVLLGNIALRRDLKEPLSQKRLEWDGPNLRFTNFPKANEYIHKTYRKGWSL
jgi:predicted dehydrogenase